MVAPSPSPHQFLLQLFFSLLPEAKTLDCLSELETEAQQIIRQMAEEAQCDSGSSIGSESRASFLGLRGRLNAVVDELQRLGAISANLRIYGKRKTPDRWADVIGALLGMWYQVSPVDFEEKYQARVETAIREAFPDAFATLPAN